MSAPIHHRIPSPRRARPQPLWRTLLLAAMLGVAATGGAQAQSGTYSTTANAEVDPPGRVARLGYAENGVSFLPAGTQDWSAASLNRPLTSGDQVATDTGARAEMHIGSTALRLGQQTQVNFSTLDDDRAFVTLQQGTLNLRVRELHQGEHLEVNTPNLAFSITQPGDYRVDVDPSNGTTRVAVPSGGGVLYGESGQTMRIGASQQIAFAGRNLNQVSAQNGVSRDAFDQWTMARDRQEDQSISARYVSRDVIGYQQLDSHGDWSSDPGLGAVWYPRVPVNNWAPYRYGHWSYIAPWGWTWVDDAPWGFAPFHYGRWTQIGPRWAWVPGPIRPRPVYAPALVAFVGGSSGGVNWNISIGGGGPGIGWFPLAPGEAYRPAYRASPRYVTNINRTVVINNNVTNVYRFQRPETVTVVREDDFRRGRPVRGDFQRVAQADLDRARVVERPEVRPEPPRRGPPDRDGDGRPDRRADGRPDARPDNRPGAPAFVDRNGDGRPDARPDARPGFNAQRPPGGRDDDAAERARRQQAADERLRNMSGEQRQQQQLRENQQREALAEQQRRSLEDGARRQQAEQAERVRRQQEEQQQRVVNQQREQQERVQRQQMEQQQRMQQQQQAEQRFQQQRSQQEQMQRQQEQAQRQQRDMQERAQRQQMEQQREQQRAQQQQQQAQQAQQAQQQRQQEQAERARQAENQRFRGQEGPPQRPMRPGMRPGDDNRS